MFDRASYPQVVDEILSLLIDALARPGSDSTLPALIAKFDLIRGDHERMALLDHGTQQAIEGINLKIQEVFANVLSAQASASFAALNVEELNLLSWSQATSFRRVADVLNLQTDYARFMILTAETATMRTLQIERWIAIADRLTQEQNYFSADALFCALTQSDIERLYITHDEVILLSDEACARLAMLKATYTKKAYLLQEIVYPAEGPKMANLIKIIGPVKAYLEGKLMQLESHKEQLKQRTGPGIAAQLSQVEKEMAELVESNVRQCWDAYRKMYSDYRILLSSRRIAWGLLRHLSSMEIQLPDVGETRLSDIVSAKNGLENDKTRLSKVEHLIAYLSVRTDVSDNERSIQQVRLCADMTRLQARIAPMERLVNSFEFYLYDCARKNKLPGRQESNETDPVSDKEAIRRRLSGVFRRIPSPLGSRVGSTLARERAASLSSPNSTSELRARTGSGIWVHTASPTPKRDSFRLPSVRHSVSLFFPPLTRRETSPRRDADLIDNRTRSGSALYKSAPLAPPASPGSPRSAKSTPRSSRK